MLSHPLSRWMLAVAAMCVLYIPAFAKDKVDFDSARAVVGRVQDDLRRTSGLSQKNDKEKERLDNAQRRLSDFDRSLSKSKFDKDRLDEAIEDLKNVVDHNTLSPEARDALNADLRQLREMRAARGVD